VYMPARGCAAHPCLLGEGMYLATHLCFPLWVETEGRCFDGVKPGSASPMKTGSTRAHSRFAEPNELHQQGLQSTDRTHMVIADTEGACLSTSLHGQGGLAGNKGPTVVVCMPLGQVSEATRVAVCGALSKSAGTRVARMAGMVEAVAREISQTSQPPLIWSPPLFWPLVDERFQPATEHASVPLSLVLRSYLAQVSPELSDDSKLTCGPLIRIGVDSTQAYEWNASHFIVPQVAAPRPDPGNLTRR
jgi:hypothetical protein